MAPPGPPRRQVRDAGPRARDPRRRGVGSRPHRRRRAAADLRLRASGALAGRPDRVDAARRRRPHHRGDRPGVPRAEGDHRAAHRPGQEDARRRRRAVRGARARRVSGATVGRAQRHLPDLQRGLLGVVGSTLDPRRIVHGGTASGPGAGRPGARPGRGARSGGADGVPVVAVRRPHRRRRPAGPARGSGPDEVGQGADRAWHRGPGARRRDVAAQGALAGVRTHCRRRSPSATPSRRPPPTPTGRASCRCTTALLQIAPSPVVELNRAVAVAMRLRTGAWHSRSSTGSTDSTTPICCPACAANCCPGWAGTPRQPPNSNGPRPWRPTIASETSSSTRQHGSALMTTTRAVLFDFSGTLFRLEEDDSWFAGIHGRRTGRRRSRPGRADAATDRTHGTLRRHGRRAYRHWVNRDLEPHLHREAYLHVLRESGLTDHHAEALYDKVIDPASWTPYPDTAAVLAGLHRQGIRTAVVSNIAFDVRPAFASTRRRRGRRRVRAVLRSGRRQADPGDLPDRAERAWASPPRTR